MILAYMLLLWCTFGSQKTAYKNQFSPSTKRGLGIELRLSDSVANAFTGVSLLSDPKTHTCLKSSPD